MPVNKNLPPMQQVSEDEIILGTGADAIRIKGKGLKLGDASTHVRGHYPDQYPWDTPHRHPEWDVRRSHACDLAFPPDNIPVAAIPGAIRELKRLAIGGWIVNAPVSEDLLEGAIVRWDATAEMWVAALAGDLTSPDDEVEEEEKPGCNCPCSCPCPLPPLPDSDLPSDVPSKPATPEKLPCTDFDPKLDNAPSQAFQPAFMGVVISGNGVQTHGVVRHASFNYPARTPLYLSATEPGRVTEENTGVFVGTVLVPGVLLLNVYAQIFDNYLLLVKEELKAKITCEMEQLLSLSKKLTAAIEAGDTANAEALEELKGFLTGRLQELQSFLDNVNRQYNELLLSMEEHDEKFAELAVEIAKGGKGYVVNTIAGREALKDYPEGTVVFVRDASDDPAVSTGPATYILVGTGVDGYWANITASINLDASDILGSIDLEALQNAIAKAHDHDNKELLDTIQRFGESGVKIGDAVLLTEAGVAPQWVVALDEAPTEANFAEVTANIPEGGLYSVPLLASNTLAEAGEVAAEAHRRLFVKLDGGGTPVGFGDTSSFENILAGLISEISKMGTYNRFSIIDTSGDWVAPLSTDYLVLTHWGGMGAVTACNYESKWCWAHPGRGGGLGFGLRYFSKDTVVAATIGAGGTGGDNISFAEIKGGQTSFADVAPTNGRHWQEASRNILAQTVVREIRAHGAGLGGGLGDYANLSPSDYKDASGNFLQKAMYNSFCDAYWYGAGGGCYVQSQGGFRCYGNGYKGCVYLLYRDPNTDDA